MARPLRILFPDAYYHVTCRGNERKPIYRDDTDRRSFIGKLEVSCEIYDVRIDAYVLMPNHFLCGAPHKKCYVKLPVM